MNSKSIFLRTISIVVCLSLGITLISPAIASTQIDIIGPPGSGEFGRTVTALPNGNFVVTDYEYDEGAIADVGAVYLYDGASATLISKLTGSTASDQIGNNGVTVLTNGNFVVSSPGWDNGPVGSVGAVTWVNGITGLSGVVSPANSLVGSTVGDRVGNGGVTALVNGNYVVSSLEWHNGPIVAAGAVTWGNGTTGVAGVVSQSNSLVGSAIGNSVGSGGVTALVNGNYVVNSPGLDNGPVWYVGAVTWGNGTTGITGTVSPDNSLMGSTEGDYIGNGGVTALVNGNYVVSNPEWHNGPIVAAGAVTWGNGVTGLVGVVSQANSLVGSTFLDFENGYVIALYNGNYVVSNPGWDNGSTVNVGAVTWGNGTTGMVGVISPANSLVGSTEGDLVGYGGVTALTNGNYVVSSRHWDNGSIAYAGAVTWGDGTIGITGAVSPANSLVGSTDNDEVGHDGVTALTNGNYVVASPDWNYDPAWGAGAVTWGNGMTGIIGVVSPANSLVGNTAHDGVGSGGVTALTNGNYVVSSPSWHNGSIAYAGAATWGNGTTGLVGVVSTTNSLVGSTAGNEVGYGGVTALANGNYAVNSPGWDNGSAWSAGAVTWGNGATGLIGVVSPANSLVGSKAYDHVGSGGVTALTNGNYVVKSPEWENGLITAAGAVTWGEVNGLTVGLITADNSVLGETAGGGYGMNSAYDEVNQQLVVGRPHENIVTLFRPDFMPVVYTTLLPMIRNQ